MAWSVNSIRECERGFAIFRRSQDKSQKCGVLLPNSESWIYREKGGFSREKRQLFEIQLSWRVLTQIGRISKPKPRSLVATPSENSLTIRNPQFATMRS